MSNPGDSAEGQNHPVSAAIVALLVLTGVMLAALLSRTPPHPPLEVPPFAMGPFLGASLAIGAAAFHLVCRGSRIGSALAVLFTLTALASFGPQKYFDPAFSRIWPAVITAQFAVVVVAGWSFGTLRRGRTSSQSDR